MNTNAPTSTSFLESGDSPLLPLGPVSERSPSVKSTPTARESSRKGSARLMPAMKASDSNAEGLEAGKRRIEKYSTCSLQTALQVCGGTSELLTEPDTEESICSQREFLASPQVKPGSASAGMMTAGSGRQLYESLVKPSRLSPCLKTLLASLLSKEDWFSNHCLLKWKATATKSARRLSFQLAASKPITIATGSLLLPTLQGQDSARGTDAGKYQRGAGGDDLPTVLAKLPAIPLPSLAARDFRTPNQNGNQADQLPNSLGLKLTSNFCEAYQGFPIGWTEIDEPESTPSETRSCRRKSSRSSKRSVKS